MALQVRVRLDTRGFRVAARRERAGAARGLRAAAEHLLGLAQDVVPLEEGVLMASGNTDVDEHALEASVYFDTVYAARQHEEVTWRHDPGRQAKYLEAPYRDARAELTRIIGAQIRRSMRA